MLDERLIDLMHKDVVDMIDKQADYIDCETLRTLALSIYRNTYATPTEKLEIDEIFNLKPELEVIRLQASAPIDWDTQEVTKTLLTTAGAKLSSTPISIISSFKTLARKCIPTQLFIFRQPTEAGRALCQGLLDVWPPLTYLQVAVSEQTIWVPL